MKIKILSFLVCSFLVLTKQSFAQELKVISVGGIAAHFSDGTADLKTNLLGLSLSSEYPIRSISFRGEINYLEPTENEKGNTPGVDNLLSINAYVGKIIGKGTQFQIPVFLGLGKTASEGDFKFNNTNVGTRVGARYYVLPRIALFADASVQYVFAKNFSYTNSAGLKETANLNPLLTQITIGFVYCYQK